MTAAAARPAAARQAFVLCEARPEARPDRAGKLGELTWASGGDDDEDDDSPDNEETKKLLHELHAAFVECDEDENGEMDEEEFTGIRDLWLSKVDHEEMTPAQLRHLFLKIDVSGACSPARRRRVPINGLRCCAAFCSTLTICVHCALVICRPTATVGWLGLR